MLCFIWRHDLFVFLNGVFFSKKKMRGRRSVGSLFGPARARRLFETEFTTEYLKSKKRQQKNIPTRFIRSTLLSANRIYIYTMFKMLCQVLIKLQNSKTKMAKKGKDIITKLFFAIYGTDHDDSGLHSSYLLLLLPLPPFSVCFSCLCLCY